VDAQGRRPHDNGRGGGEGADMRSVKTRLSTVAAPTPGAAARSDCYPTLAGVALAARERSRPRAAYRATHGAPHNACPGAVTNDG